MFAGRFKQLHYKKLFLFGAYFIIMLLTIPTAVIDYMIGNYADVMIDLVYGLLTWTAYRFSFIHGETGRAAIWLFWIAALIEFAFLYVHNIDFNLIFSLLIPMIAFIAMSRRAIIINLALFYVLLSGYMTYGYLTYPSHPYLHNSSFLLAFVVSHGFIIAFGVFYGMAIEESVRRLEESNRTKSLLLSEVHHRVKNNLNLIASILGIQSQRMEGSEAGTVLEANRHRIESMAILHEILYKSDLAGDVDLRTYLSGLTEHIVLSVPDDSIALHSSIAPVRLPMGQMILLGILINEWMANSIKHSPDDQGKVVIKIFFGRGADGYVMEYCDRATDIEADKLTDGFGYSLINLAIDQLNGKVDISTKNGLCYKVNFEYMKEIGSE
jgi:two-component sensor histidine kinase